MSKKDLMKKVLSGQLIRLQMWLAQPPKSAEKFVVGHNGLWISGREYQGTGGWTFNVTTDATKAERFTSKDALIALRMVGAPYAILKAEVSKRDIKQCIREIEIMLDVLHEEEVFGGE